MTFCAELCLSRVRMSKDPLLVPLVPKPHLEMAEARWEENAKEAPDTQTPIKRPSDVDFPFVPDHFDRLNLLGNCLAQATLHGLQESRFHPSAGGFITKFGKSIFDVIMCKVDVQWRYTVHLPLPALLRLRQR
eukprot:CAMPEP_0180711872 /NCGR_PEP_ID=MMETSP1038_2-20121128/11082_1 /TAXON_ID=632150 /ORGANISM="Azadinium spinosum, Strain 3D9" /LENGTH=132 /DNA_ID=CAMNT_0022744123 /DNA_START=117 /DNA_END=511 /DNA_ORIENTATION=+